MLGSRTSETRLSRGLRSLILPVTLVVLSAAIIGVYSALGAQRQAFQAVDHSREVQRRIDQTISLLAEAETGQRGYLLTGDSRDLEPYHAAVAQLPAIVQSLAGLTADNIVQSQQLASVQGYLQEKLTELSSTVSLREAGDTEGASHSVRSGRGTELLQDLRAGLLKMADEEQRLLVERSRNASMARGITQAAVAALGALTLLLLWLLYRVMSRGSASLLESEERLSSTLASVGDAIITTDVKGQIERMNAVAERLTGYTRAEAKGRALQDVFAIVNERTRESVENPFDKVMRDSGGVGRANHTVLRSRDGVERPIDDICTPIEDSQGKIAGIVLVFRDASERHAANRQIAESEARFRGTFENAAVGIAHVSLEGRFLRVNEAFLRITAYDSQALIGKTFGDITHPDDLDGDWAQAKALAEGQTPSYALQKRYRRPDGGYVWVNLTVGLQRDERGAPLFYISSIEDISQQRQTLQALRDSEARFRDIADATPVLIWISDVDKKVVWFNSRWLEFTGRTMEQEKGTGWMDGVHPDDIDRCVVVYEQAFSRRESYRTEYRRRRADGQWRTLDASGVPRYVDGAFVGYIGSCIDVTEQQSAARSLADSEEQLRLATEAAEIGLWDWDPIANTVYWPPRLKSMFGIPPDQAVTMQDFYSGLHPEDRDTTVASLDEARDPELQAYYDVEFRTIGRSDGRIRWVAAKGRGIFKDGLCVRVVGTSMDITRRRTAESRLRELNEQLERRVDEALAERGVLLDIVEATDARVMVLDPGYRILAINRATASDLNQLFHVRATVGDNLLDLLAPFPEARDMAQTYWGRALRGEEYTAVDEFKGGDDRRHYEMKFNSLRDANGNFLGAFQFVYDVTERLREQARLAEAENHLRQTQKFDAIGQLSGGIAHDFNNLLMVISGGLSLLQRSDDAEKRQRIVERMRQAAERGASLSRQLLTFARRRPLRAEALNLRQQIAGMREILDRTLRGDVVVETDLPAELWPIMADPAELELVLLNLCVNARDAMPSGGTILISAANSPAVRDEGLAGDFVTLSVADSGFGMSPEVMARVFEPFFTTKELGKGSGLGLAQVYGFAQQSGGTVRIESVPAKGTVVHLLVPRSQHAPESVIDVRETEAVSRSRLSQGSVLLVEDAEEVAALVSEMLSELGYRVTRVASAQAALGALADNREIDLVFSDVMMPGPMNGLDLARELRQRRPDLPVLLTSGYAGEALSSAEAERVAVLAKPYELAELDAALRAARRRRAIR